MGKFWLVSLFIIFLVIFIISYKNLIKKDTLIINGGSIKNKNNNNNEKPTIVLFHADWCGFCTKMLPEWEKLKKYSKKNNTFNVLDIEHSTFENFPQELITNINTLPTIVLYPKGIKNTKNKILYDYPNRTFDDFLSFIKNNSS